MRYADMIAARFRTNHHSTIMAAESIITLLPKTIAYYDAPMAEPTDVATYVLAQEAARGDEDGADRRRRRRVRWPATPNINSSRMPTFTRRLSHSASMTH